MSGAARGPDEPPLKVTPGAVSATAFEFIATTRPDREVRAFVGRLPEALLR